MLELYLIKINFQAIGKINFFLKVEDVIKINFEVLIQLIIIFFYKICKTTHSQIKPLFYLYFIKNTNLSKVGIFRDVLPWIIFSIGVGSGKSEKLFNCANSPTLLLWTVSCLVAKKIPAVYIRFNLLIFSIKRIWMWKKEDFSIGNF